MAHRPLYRKSKSNWLGIFLILVAAVAAAGWIYQNLIAFNPQKLVDNSELKDKNFAGKVVEITSPKYGLKAYWLEDKTNPIISVSFAFKGAGYASDDEDKQGIANLTAALLSDGAGDLNSQAFKEELENKGIGLSFAAGKDDFSGALLTTRDNQTRAFELLKLALRQARFEPEEIAREKAGLLEMLKRQKEHPASLLGLEFAKELYGNHNYARNPLGEEADISKISREQMQIFVLERLSRQNLVVGIAGDISQTEAETMLDEVFGALPANGRLNFVRNAEVVFDGRVKVIKQTVGQNIAMKAALGVDRSHEDFYPLYIANQIIGGSGLNSRLSQEIREKAGLTYGIYSYLSLDDKLPLLMIGFSTTPDNYERASQMFAKEWQRFADEGINEQELAKAKNYLIASNNLRFASINNLADMLTAMQKYNLGLDFLQKRNDYVRQVNIEQVNQAAKKYFNNNNLVNVSIGSF